jgi:hypothetical protein
MCREAGTMRAALIDSSANYKLITLEASPPGIYCKIFARPRRPIWSGALKRNGQSMDETARIIMKSEDTRPVFKFAL